MSSSEPRAATVQTLAAEVRVLMVGSRQVTLSVYRQLDYAPVDEVEPFGRVNDNRDDVSWRVWAVGRHRSTGALVKTYRAFEPDSRPYSWNKPCEIKPGDVPGLRTDWAQIGPHCRIGYTSRFWDSEQRVYRIGDLTYTLAELNALPERPAGGVIARRGDYAATWTIPGDALVSEEVAPGGWRFADPDTRKLAEEDAEKALDAIHATVKQWQEWKALPLIVLAGLR